MLASELLLCRGRRQEQQNVASAFSDDMLEILASSGVLAGKIKACSGISAANGLATSSPSPRDNNLFPTNNSPTPSSDKFSVSVENAVSNNYSSSTKLKIINLEKEIVALREKDRANMSSLGFYTDKCERLQHQASQHKEELIQIQSERDFYKMNCPVAGLRDPLGAFPQTMVSDEKGKEDEVKEFTDKSQIDVIGGYIRQINRLNGIIASLQLRHSEEGAQFHTHENILETEFTSNIAKLFTSTERQLRSDTKILRQIENCPSDEDGDGSDENSSVVELDGGEENFELKDKLYQHRTKLITTEVFDISESIHFKEELVHQLHQSQKQYEAMKEFYESKLESLCEEMETKELEKQRVVDDLRDASLSLQNEHFEDEHIRKEREERLKKLLHKKELELKALKKRQVELTNLSKVQSRSFDQIKRLETDILDLKKQRISLSKSLQQEKKNFLSSLNSKAKEIDKLKKELSSALAKMTKLGKEKEQSNSKINKMLQDEIFRRKRFAEAQREHLFKVGKGSRRVSPTPRSTRRMLQSLVRTSHTDDSIALDEQKTRSWIEASTRLLVDYDEAVEDLSVQCEQQLVLLHKKKDLEESKRSLISRSGSAEELSDINIAISKVSNQLKCRNTEISQKKTEIDNDASISISKDDIVQQMFKKVESSASDLKSILKILFEMILASQKQANIKSKKLQESLQKQRTQQLALDDVVDKLNSQASNYRREIARIEKEYQSKMMGLFNHSGFHELIKTDASRHRNIVAGNERKIDYSTDNKDDTGTHNEDDYSSDGFKAAIAVAEERNAALQSQLSREELRVRELETFVDECNIEARLIHERYDSKCRENVFLEEECRMLRDIVGDLKTNKSGPSDLLSHSLPTPPVSDSNVEFDDETESVLGQYSVLRDEIMNTGSVLTGDNAAAPNSSIFDRLTNPSYFTGTQKNIFKTDVREVNRAKVQQRKGGANKKERRRKDEPRTPPSAVFYRAGGEDRHDDRRVEEVLIPKMTLQEKSWFDNGESTSSGSFEQLQQQQESPLRTSSPSNPSSAKKPSTTTPSNSKSPSCNLNENVFSRLLNPNKFTGIHRPRHLDSPS